MEEDNLYKLAVWGANNFGQIGLQDKTRSNPHPVYWSFHKLVKQISCGDEHSGFVTEDGCVYTLGSNRNGKLGVGS